MQDEANCSPAAGASRHRRRKATRFIFRWWTGTATLASFRSRSVYLSFGSGVVVDEFGFHLQNRGALFEMDAEHPNALAPRKRPLHTIIPAFMEKGGICTSASGLWAGITRHRRMRNSFPTW